MSNDVPDLHINRVCTEKAGNHTRQYTQAHRPTISPIRIQSRSLSGAHIQVRLFTQKRTHMYTYSKRVRPTIYLHTRTLAGSHVNVCTHARILARVPIHSCQEICIEQPPPRPLSVNSMVVRVRILHVYICMTANETVAYM